MHFMVYFWILRPKAYNLSNMPAAIVAKNLNVTKDRSDILNNLSFKVSTGSITGLIGPSGSGKTTLMRSIVGVQKITSGSLEVLDTAAGNARLRNRIGYVSQSPSVYSDLTVAQNLEYFSALTKANDSQVDNIISQVKLTKQRNQVVDSLSGGQKARVSLAVALLGDPDLLVLDEPTVGLDPLLRQELWQFLNGLADAGKTLLISSHVMAEAERCDNLLLLHEGYLLWNDTRQRLLKFTDTDSTEAAFIKSIKQKVAS